MQPVVFYSRTYFQFIRACRRSIDPSIDATNVDEKIADYLNNFRSEIPFKNPKLIHTIFLNRWRKWEKQPCSKIERACIKIKMACEAVGNPLIGFLYNYSTMESLSSHLTIDDLLNLEKIRNTPALKCVIKKKIDFERIPLAKLGIQTITEAVAFAKKYHLDVLNVQGIFSKVEIAEIASLSLNALLIDSTLKSRELAEVVKNTRLQCLALHSSNGIKYITQCPSLRELFIVTCSIKGWKNIGDLKLLTNLNLKYCSFPSADFILQLTNLKNLSLEGCKSVPINYIGELTRLQRLDLRHIYGHYHETILRYLSNLTQLEHLYLPERLRLGDTDLNVMSGRLHRLKTLSLPLCSDLSNDKLSYFNMLSDLEDLDISECSRVTGKGLVRITDLTKLKCLNLNRIGHIQVDNFIRFTQLQKLTFEAATLIESSFASIVSLKQLEYLSFSSCIYHENELMHSISLLTRLRVLMLKWCPHLDDSGVKCLSSLSRLEKLMIPEGEITDKGVPYLAKLTTLRALNIQGNREITDSALMHLTALTNLILLDVSYRKPTAELEKFVKSFKQKVRIIV